MKKIAFLAALLAGALLAAQAHAQARATGAYFGAGVMQVYTDNATEFAYFSIPAGGNADSTATSFKVYGGYVWPARFGIEVGYYDLGTYDVFTFNTKSDEFKTTALAFSGTFSLPLNPSAEVLFKFGLAFTDADYRCFSACGWPYVNTSHSDISPLMGIGIGWRIAPSFSVRADWEYFGLVTHSVGGMIAEYDYSAVSIAGQFHF
jgi:opacity protein-like surface antigen